nr:TetR/AcrR family transcriptional regulator [Rhodococcus sp. (in: high G+C Gram-positive bacteria)]
MDSPAARSRTYGGKSLAVRRAERRSAFLRAGVDVFGEKGYASSSITDVCKASGLARNQFYAEFDSRETLLIEVYENIQSDARDAVAEVLGALAEPTDFGETVAAAMAALLGSLGSDPRRARICYIEMLGVSPRVEEYRAARRQIWADYIADAIRGEVGESFVPPGGYRAATWGFLGALTELGSRWSLSDPRPPLDDLIEAMTAILRAFLPGQAVNRTDKLD